MIGVVCVVMSTTGAAVYFHSLERRRIRSQFLDAYHSVQQARLRAGTPAFEQADLAARQELSTLDTMSLTPGDDKALSAISHYLQSVEMLDASVGEGNGASSRAQVISSGRQAASAIQAIP